MRKYLGNARVALGLVALGLLTAVAGCGPQSTARFHFNRVFAVVTATENKKEKELNDTVVQGVVDRLDGLFGTPDEPRLPGTAELKIDEVLDAGKVKLAAGPVKRDLEGVNASGLYRQHCAHCHGVSGDGAGPTAAFLNPYPRDYRPGKFKFRSTPIGVPPTHDDLKQVLIEGIPGTAMPSFKLLKDAELESLVHYVKYLSIRGQTEQSLLRVWIAEGELPGTPEDPSGVFAVVQEVVDSWREAAGKVSSVPPRPSWTEEQRLAAVEKGRKIYYGAGGCAGCHGDTQLGDGNRALYDFWTNPIMEQAKKDPGAVGQYVALGAMPPRALPPRNLRSGIYRGGRRPIDLFWRVRNGIEPSQMPVAAPDKLSDENVWEVVEYVRSLPFEPLSYPRAHVPTYQKPRN